MALLLHQLVNDYLPSKKRQNAKGWWTFNAPCCHHRGHNHDTRGRGNFISLPDGVMRTNCYNCGFKATYKGGDISHGFEQWMSYLGIPYEKIQQAKMEILSKTLSGEIESIKSEEWFRPEEFSEVPLPPGSQPLSYWLSLDDPPEGVAPCIEYLIGRGRAVAENWDYYWSPGSNTYPWRRVQLERRLIIPFKHKGKVVGYTGRYIGKPPPGVSKYHNSDLPSGYLFNGDVLFNRRRKFVLVTEGPLDAIAIDGVSPLGSTLNRLQVSWLMSTDAEKIVVPDREANNQDLIDEALKHGWSVSFPEWGDGIKDAADASRKYGRLYTVSSIISSRTRNHLEIGIKRKMLKG